MTDLLVNDAQPDSRVEEALATGLLTVDGARRVGWAKAFAALRRVDSLEEEIRQMRDEMKYLRRSYSRILGFIEHIDIPRSPVMDEELAAHLAAETTFRDVGARNQGKFLALRHKAHLRGWSEEDVKRKRSKSAARIKYAVERGRELRLAARNIGHLTTIRRRQRGDEFLTGVGCSCGERFVGEDHDAQSWRYNHLAMAVHGCSYADYRKLYAAKHRSVAGDATADNGGAT